jgi:hypothetical protein
MAPPVYLLLADIDWFNIHVQIVDQGDLEVGDANT